MGKGKPYIRLVREVSPYKVYLVDGTYVRLHLDPDFTMGANPEAKRYVPKNEIWIDNDIGKDEVDNVIVHEVAETSLMARGLDYGVAHEKVNIPEGVRRRLGVEEDK